MGTCHGHLVDAQIKGLDHNDFISQGGIHKDLQYRLRFGPAAKAEERPTKDIEAKEKAELDAVRAGLRDELPWASWPERNAPRTAASSSAPIIGCAMRITVRRTPIRTQT